MTKFFFDGMNYETENLTDNGKAQVASLQFLNVQMATLRNEMSVFKTARQAYIVSLKTELQKSAQTQADGSTE